MDVSIVIVNYQTTQMVIDCLASVFFHTNEIKFEVIIVDNDPESNAEFRIIEQFPSVRYLRMDSNRGFGVANNVGMKSAFGRYFLLLNADTLLTDNVIARFVKRMDDRPDIIACGAMQYDAEDKPMNYFTSFNDFRKTFFILPPGQVSDKILSFLFPEPKYEDPERHDWLVGAFIFLRREGFEKTGGFDEDFFMYGEDVEWCSRLGRLGALYYFKDSKFIHLENGNPYRRTRISWINRFSTQMQVSNMFWIRKQYGIAAYLILIAHYLTMIPVVFLWRISLNLKESGRPFSPLITQYIYLRKVRVLLKFFWKTLLLKKGPHKINSSDNIDLLYQI